MADESTHLLLIERDRSTAGLIEEMLRLSWADGLSWTFAQRVEDVSQQLVAGTASAVLLGGIDQAAAVERLRALAPRVPVVVLASEYSEGAAAVALRAGAEDVLAKAHMTPMSLRRAVQHAIERKRSHERVAQRALQDPLTGLPNRTLFLDRLGVALERTRRTGAVTGVLFLDVDGFKKINDSLGHAAGDRVLSALAGRLQSVLRPMDTVARFGGDEFTFLFEDLANADEVVKISERIRTAASLPIGRGEDRHELNVSIGVATTSDPAVSPEALIGRADAAMYEAKRAAAGSRPDGDPDDSDPTPSPVAGDDPDRWPPRPAEPPADATRWTDAPADAEIRPHENGTAATLARVRDEIEPAPPVNEPARAATGAAEAIAAPDLARQLRGALERSELTVLYQPHHDLGPEQRLVGFEALVRWEHPQHGTILPADFIPLAEEIGLLSTIGQFVLGQSLELLARLRPSRSDLTLSINVSAEQLRAPEVSAALAAVSAAGLDPRTVCLEVTESTVSEDTDAVLDAARVLKAAGMRMAIDDYGTGAASLHSLRSLRADELKIAPHFVGELAGAAHDATMVAAVVELGHALGMRVTAEGVETDEQLAELRSLGCDAAQGFALSRPMSAAQLEQLVLGGVAA
jgi:diguanylate cyclase (GGDEF)-like protein